MNRYATVENGIVTNLIAYDGKSETGYNTPPIAIDELSVSVGDRYVNGVFYIRPLDGFEYQFTADKGWIITTAGQADKDAAAIVYAEHEKASRLAYASQITLDWRTMLLLGEISDEDKAKLSGWMRYIEDVKIVDTSTAPNLEWPALPSE